MSEPTGNAGPENLEASRGEGSDLRLLKRIDFEKNLFALSEMKAEWAVFKKTAIGLMVRAKKENPALDYRKMKHKAILSAIVKSGLTMNAEEAETIRIAREALNSATYKTASAIGKLDKGFDSIVSEVDTELALATDQEAKAKLQAEVEQKRQGNQTAKAENPKGADHAKPAERAEAPTTAAPASAAALAEARAKVEEEKLKKQVGTPEKKGFETLPENLRQQAEYVRSVSMLEIIPGLAKEGAGESELSNLSNLPYLLKDFPGYVPSAQGAKVIQELQAIIESPNKDNYSRAIDKEWKTFAKEGYQSAKIAFGEEFKDEKMTDSAIRFAKRSFQKHPVLSTAAVVAGAYGAYRLFSWIFGGKKEEGKADEKSEKKEKSFWGKTIPFLAGGGALFLLGRYFWDDIKSYFEKGKKAKEVAQNVGNLDVLGIALSGMELAGVKFDNLDPRPQDRQASELVNSLLANQPEGDKLQTISPNAISVYRKMKLGAVSNVLSKISDKSVLLTNLGENKEYAGGFLKAIIANPALGDEIYTFHRIANTVKDRHLPIGEIKDDMTIEQVSDFLVKNHEAITADFQKKSRTKGEGKTKSEKVADAAKKASERIGETGSVLLAAFRKEIGNKEKNGRTIDAIIDKYEVQQKTAGVLDTVDNLGTLISDITEVLEANGMNLVFMGPKVIVMNGPQIVLQSSWRALSQTAWGVISHPASPIENGLVYLSETSPIIILGAVGGGVVGSAKGLLGYLLPLGEKGITKGAIKGAAKGAKEGLLLPLKLFRKGVGIPRNLAHFQEYSSILGEEVRLAKEWTKAATLGRLKGSIEEAYNLKRLHLLLRQKKYALVMKDSPWKIPIIDRRMYAGEIDEIGESIHTVTKQMRSPREIQDLVEIIADRVPDLKAGSGLVDRPGLLELMTKNEELKGLLLSPESQGALRSESFMGTIDQMLKRGETPEALMEKIKNFKPGEVAKVASEGLKTAAEEPKVAQQVERAKEFNTRFDELKGKIKTQNELIRSQAEARKMSVADFLAKDPQGIELARQLKNLEDEGGQAKQLAKIFGDSKSAFGRLLNESPELLETVSRNDEFGRNLLNEFLALDKRTVESLMGKGDETLNLIAQGNRIRERMEGPAKEMEAISKKIWDATMKSGKSADEFMKTPEAERLMESLAKAEDEFGMLQRTQKLLRTQNSPFGKLLRENSDLLQGVMGNTEIRNQFFALDKRLVVHCAKDAEGGKEIVNALMSGDKTMIDSAIEKIGGKLGIKNALKAQAERVKNGMSYAMDTIEGLPASAKKMFRGAKESVAQQWDGLISKFNKTEGFKIELETLNSLAKNKNAAEIVEILKKQGLQTEKIDAKILEEAAQRIAKAEDAGSIAKEIEGLAKAAKTEALFSPKISRAAWALRWAGKGLGYGLAGLGLLGGAYETGSSLYEAATTNVEGRRDVMLEKGALFGLDTGVNALVVFSRFIPATSILAGSTGTVFGSSALAVVLPSTVGGAAAFAIAPITYMGSSAIESKLEATKTANEWAAVNPTLLKHEWLTTGGESAGDLYRIATPFAASRKEIDAEHQNTREKMVEAILRQEDGEVDPDRLEFIRNRYKSTGYEKYDLSQMILMESRIYAEMMKNRRMQKAQGASEYLVGNLDLMDERFEKPGASEMGRMIDEYELNAMRGMDKRWKENFDRLSTGSLADLSFQIRNKAEKAEGGMSEGQIKFLVDVENYLKLKRNVNLGYEYAMRAHNKMEEISKEKLSDLLDRFDGTVVKNDLEKEVAKITDTPACYALCKMAEFFGYSGHQEIDELKSFFTEANKNALAVYWDGKSWYLNQAGWDRDNEIGAELNEDAITKIVKLLNKTPDDIFGHRQESVVDMWGGPVVDLSSQALRCGMILEQALKDYPNLNKKAQQVPEKSPPIANQGAVNEKAETRA